MKRSPITSVLRMRCPFVHLDYARQDSGVHETQGPRPSARAVHRETWVRGARVPPRRSTERCPRSRQ